MSKSQKGGAQEREIAKVLSEWLTGNRTPPVLWRSTQSGGWKHKGNRHIGDLAPNGPEGEHLCSMVGIEVKHRRAAEMDFWFAFSRGDTMPIWQWWTKLCEEECIPARKLPWLIIKRNNYPTLIGTTMKHEFPMLTLTGLTSGLPSANFILLDTFLSHYTIKDIEREHEVTYV